MKPLGHKKVRRGQSRREKQRIKEEHSPTSRRKEFHAQVR